MKRRPVIGFCLSLAPLIGLFMVPGCSGLKPPDVDPEEAAARAMELYDKNADGAIDETELKACPPLYAAAYEYDLDGDRRIVVEEIVDRLKAMYESGVALTTADCNVSLDGRPLAGATVRYVPDPFLGDVTHPAEGVTDQLGFAPIVIADEHLPEDQRGRMRVQVGLYRVEITHPSQNIPAKYNANTELGFEIHPYSHSGTSAKYNLRSK